MSEQGWKAFLAAEGLEDWSVLHGGAAAFFQTPSLAAAAALAEAIAHRPALRDRGVVLTLSDRGVAVRLTRDVWQLEDEHVALARAVSAAARERGATAMPAAVQEVQVAVSAAPEELDAAFWRAVLGYAPAAEDNLVDPLAHGSTFWFQEVGEGKPPRPAFHIDVSVPRSEAAARLQAALDAGGRMVDESRAPAHWTLADRAGNRACICAWPDTAEPGN